MKFCMDVSIDNSKKITLGTARYSNILEKVGHLMHPSDHVALVYCVCPLTFSKALHDKSTLSCITTTDAVLTSWAEIICSLHPETVFSP